MKLRPLVWKSRPAVRTDAEAPKRSREIYFAAPLELDAPADAIRTPSPAFSLLLEDCCRAYAGEEPMVLKKGQIVKTRIGSRELVLKDNFEITWEEC